VGVAEYARPNTGVRTTHGSSANGALPTTGMPITRAKNANSAQLVRSPENDKKKKLLGERLTESLLQFPIAPHQFEKTNRIAHWTNLTHLIGVNSRDWDRFNPVAFAAGDDERFGVVIESVSAAK
jgi:hypothetical protein